MGSVQRHCEDAVGLGTESSNDEGRSRVLLWQTASFISKFSTQHRLID